MKQAIFELIRLYRINFNELLAVSCETSLFHFMFIDSCNEVYILNIHRCENQQTTTVNRPWNNKTNIRHLKYI